MNFFFTKFEKLYFSDQSNIPKFKTDVIIETIAPGFPQLRFQGRKPRRHYQSHACPSSIFDQIKKRFHAVVGKVFTFPLKPNVSALGNGKGTQSLRYAERENGSLHQKAPFNFTVTSVAHL